MPSTRPSSSTPSGRRIPPPRPAQLGYLRRLARRTNTTFTTPRTIAEASAEIDRMLLLPAGSAVDFADADRERRAMRDEFDQGYGTAPDDSEIVGWGSGAHWRTTE
jgi:hypothetical protein